LSVIDAPARGKGKLYSYAGLRARGILFHPNHIRRLVQAGKFPAPVYIGERRPVWTEESIEAWLAELERARDQGRSLAQVQQREARAG
jgi:hypothetical protein